MFIFVGKKRTKNFSQYLINYTLIRLIIILEDCYEYFLLEILYTSLIKNTYSFFKINPNQNNITFSRKVCNDIKNVFDKLLFFHTANFH